ncbi:hypothetical protein EPN44_02965 [bacterium]|nr:MAG: hypothetical protein EPN44_02965 [bacterium]
MRPHRDHEGRPRGSVRLDGRAAIRRYLRALAGRRLSRDYRVSSLEPLWYLERRRIGNAARQLLRSPGRLVLWILFVVWVVSQTYVRVAEAHGPHADPVLASSALAGGLAIAALLWAVGAAVHGVLQGNIGAFASPADGRFLTSSAIEPQLVVLWVQLRAIVASALRGAWGALIFLLVWHVRASAGATILGASAFLTSLATVFALRLPLALLLRAHPGLRVIVRVISLAAFAGIAAFLVSELAAAFGRPLVPALPVIEPLAHAAIGGYAARIFDGPGGVVYLLADLVLIALLLSAGRRNAADVYPELWTSSQQYFRMLSARRRMGGATPEARTPRVALGEGLHAPSGAAILLWKDWLAFTRAPGKLWWGTAYLSGALIAGGTVGLFVRDTGRTDVLWPLASACGYLLLFSVSFGAVQVNEDLRKPLWWFSAGSLAARVFMWNVAATWRFAAVLAVGCTALALGARLPAAALVGVVGLPLILLQFRATGILTQMVLPRAGDLRGPGALLRILGSMLSLIPPVVAAALASLFHPGSLAVFAAAIAGSLGTAIAVASATAALLRRHGAEPALTA